MKTAMVLVVLVFGTLMMTDPSGEPQIYSVTPNGGGGTQIIDMTGDRAGTITQVQPTVPGGNSGMYYDSGGNSGMYIYTPDGSSGRDAYGNPRY